MEKRGEGGGVTSKKIAPTMPPQDAWTFMRRGFARRHKSCLRSPKFVEEQKHILLTHHPRTERRSGPRSLRMTANFVPGINPRPTARMSFSASCKAVPFQNRYMRWVLVCAEAGKLYAKWEEEFSFAAMMRGCFRGRRWTMDGSLWLGAASGGVLGWPVGAAF